MADDQQGEASPPSPRLSTRRVSAHPLRAAGIVYAVVAIACTRIPLLNYLGYEFSALIALVGSCIAGVTTIRIIGGVYHASYPDDAEVPAAVRRALGTAAIGNIVLLLIPLVIISANAFFIRNCSWGEGAAFFFLLPFVSVLFGTALGFLCAVHYRHPRLMFFVYCAILVGYSIVLGYVTPAIFSYNFLYGYFPGLTYDEILPLTGTLVLFRLLTLLLAAACVWLGMIILEDSSPRDSAVVKGIRLVGGLVAPGRRIRTAGIMVALAAFTMLRCELGFESTAGYIRESLGSELRTEHFVIYYAPSSMSEDEIRRVGKEHEFELHQILEAFALPPTIRLSSYIYPSVESKRRFIGAGNTDITKPWNGEIHLAQQSLEGSLRHELVHAAAAPFGLPVIRASLSTGLVEGLAMALGGEWGTRTLHEYAAAMRAYGVAPDIKGLMSFWGFASQHSSVSYVLAGSFCKYLIDRYGMRKMTLIYRTTNYAGVYGRTLDQLIAEWHAYLDRYTVEEEDRDCVDALFRRPPIFGKICPRVLARRTVDARVALVRRNYPAAESLFADIYSEGHSYEALSGRLTSALRRGRYRVLTGALDTIVGPDEHPARFLPLFIAMGDACWAEGEQARAAALYERIYHADLSDPLTEAAGIRLLALHDEREGSPFLPLFLSDAPDSVRAVAIDSVLEARGEIPWLLYLKGRMLMRLGNDARAVNVLKRVDLLNADRALDALRQRYLGESLYRLGRYDEARTCFWTSLDAEYSDAAEERINTWIDRCEWMQAHAR
ncbi:MAG: hypothetical protein AB1428_01785 [Bacteroidota bacterium]